MNIPFIDPNVHYYGVSELRKFNAERLRQLSGAVVLTDNGEPLAVVISFATYMEIQQRVNATEKDG